MEEIHHKVERMHAWYEDNGAWGAKTKLAQVWDWMVSVRDVFKKHDEDIEELYYKIDTKLDRQECTIKHDKLVRDIEKMLDARERSWKWWFEQFKWLLPTLGMLFMYLHQIGLLHVVKE